MFSPQTEEVQITLDQAKNKVKLVEALDRLERNKDFKLVIGEEFLKQEPLRLVGCLSDPSLQAPHMQAAFVADMRAGSALLAFFRLLRKNGDAAAQSIIDSEEQLEQLRSAEAE